MAALLDANTGGQSPFGDNSPSAWRRRVWISLLAGVAFLIAGYMALYQWGITKSVWDPVFGPGSERVLTSELSEQMQTWLRIPDAALGALAYLAEIILGLAGSDRRWQTKPWLVMAFGLNVIALGIAGVTLVIFQGSVVGYWCFLCLVTATISVFLVILASHEIGACLLFLWLTWRRKHNRKILWNAFWGRASHDADSAFELSQQSKAT